MSRRDRKTDEGHAIRNITKPTNPREAGHPNQEKPRDSTQVKASPMTVANDNDCLFYNYIQKKIINH